ncbi:TOBE domain-containing protein [Arcobacter arenosus]|uniref:LysR family transcriptional regulator n=1 Tax=Arcobacter arenosus TaxID=2576037 RepID=A0A5R8Y2S1_9BACT|nr:TOBE domain-containing protein [Arcobacter arenosus]TLP39379.1 LysR family transcriptional regulator [Arcobacter arenosus]
MEFTSSLAILNSQTPFLLEKRIKLLKEIAIVGSISKAAKNVPMSYKTAWEAIDTINNLCPEKVVTKETGGVGGGGAKLTPYGKNLIETYEKVQYEHEKFLKTLSNLTDFNTGSLKSLRRINMQLSTRNQIQGVVELINKGGVNSEVFIKLKSGYTLVAIITNSAVDSLDLQIEDEVTSLFKSSSVLVTTDCSLTISARNKLQGKITNITDGEVNSEVSIDIGNGDIVAAIITSDSVKSLGLKVFDEVSAVIKASDVMIGK